MSPPTLLDLFGLPRLDESEGSSVMDLVTKPGAATARSIPSALLRFPHAPGAPQQFSLLSAAGRKVIVGSDGKRQSFDLNTDPHERGEQPVEAPEVERDLARRLAEYDRRARAFSERHGALDSGQLDLEELRRLRALGYIE